MRVRVRVVGPVWRALALVPMLGGAVSHLVPVRRNWALAEAETPLTWEDFYLAVECESAVRPDWVWSYDSGLTISVVDSGNCWGGWAYVTEREAPCP